MIIQWCLKGIQESAAFGDPQVLDVLSRFGLIANWLRHPPNAGLLIGDGLADAHQALSDTALSNHVNAYAAVAGTTPYVSLTAGVIERDPATRTPITHSAWITALDFATDGGKTAGYVFECWVSVPPKPAPELPGFAEEVRDLNLHRGAAWWHHEGEVAAKLVVPPRQIQRVTKYDRTLAMIGLAANILNFAPGGENPYFVPPERISNIRGLVV